MYSKGRIPGKWKKWGEGEQQHMPPTHPPQKKPHPNKQKIFLFNLHLF